MRFYNRLGLALFALLATAPLAWAQEFVVSFGGDVNFARSRQSPLPDQIHKFGLLAIEDATKSLRPFWTADLNIINVETVVSERDGYGDLGKAFIFRSHPASFRHLMDLGVNGFGLANNHAFDHGVQGMEDTLAFFQSEAQSRPDPMVFAGVGLGDGAFAPSIATFGGVTVAFASATIGSGAFGPQSDRVGVAFLTVPSHFNAILQGLKAAQADLKILSLHYGTENMIQLNPGQRQMFRRAIEEAGVNLVIGSHPHVVRAVEADPDMGEAIFYSMGNLLFIGGAEKDSAPLGQDYGLMGRAYFQKDRGSWRISALEAVPFRSVHLAPVIPDPARTARTIQHLNQLSLASVGAKDAVTFLTTGIANESGAACFDLPWGPRTAALCCPRSRQRIPQCDLPDPMQ